MYGVKKWCKCGKYRGFDLNTMEYFPYTSVPLERIRRTHYSGVNYQRGFVEMDYYLVSQENQLIGPLYDWEEVEGELEYLRDPLGNDYVPGRVYKIIRKW